MAKTRQKKDEEIKKLAEELSRAKSLVFVNFNGLKVKEIEDLRKRCRKENIGYTVIKKTLMKMALKNAGLTDIDPKSFSAESALVLGYEDEIAPARVIETFAKEHEALKAFGGVLDGKFVGRDKVVELSKLPSKEELLAKVIGSIKAPVSGFVNVLAGNLRNLVCVLSAIKEAKN
ncbi:MAG: 50S ribosomal protein L10 [Patescibacteria group bacterium]|jgi:large subunit ribosomal protein L10